MRKLWMTAAIGMTLAGPAAAQSLDDAGRLLKRVLPGQQQQPNQGQSERDRQIYEQGRRDQEDARRREGGINEGRLDDRRQNERRLDERRRADDRQRYNNDQDRRRSDQNRAYDEDDQPRRQPNRN